MRLIEIAGLDLNTCGGTHLSHTGQLQAMAARVDRASINLLGELGALG